jgi:hypothetical protein
MIKMIKINYFRNYGNGNILVDTMFYNPNLSKEQIEKQAQEACDILLHDDYEICNPHDIKE